MLLTRLEDRYNNDQAFHAVVNMLQKVIMDMQLAPSEVRDAATFAVFLIELRRPPDPIRLEELHRDWKEACIDEQTRRTRKA